MSIENSNSTHSITRYIEGLRRGDEYAAQKTWERFIGRLIPLACRKLKSAPTRAEDEEDVVQKAFAQFFRQVETGRFSKLNDRDDLWQVLCVLVERRAIDQIKKQNARKNGAGRVKGESLWFVPDLSRAAAGINGVADDVQPTPELAFEMSEVLRERLATLKNEEHRKVALMKLQGFSNEEIAEQIGSSSRTVERWLRKMRENWTVVDGVD